MLNPSHKCHARARVLFVLAITIVLALLPGAPVLADSPDEVEATPAGVEWLEPQGINIVDMVGVVPEEYLKGATIVYTPGFGTLIYESGSRNGDLVTITAKASTRYIIDGNWNGTLFSCLGQPARIDQIGTVSPATTLRVYAGSRDVTGEVDLYSYLPSGRQLPVLNPKESESANQYRYWETSLTQPPRTPDGQIALPANMGCELVMSFRNYRDLKLVFTARSPKTVDIKVTGKQTIVFRSYLGPGYRGHLDSLVHQLYAAKYWDRAEYFAMTIPAGSDYFFVNYPQMSADPYTSFRGNPVGNVDRPTSGTYRVVMGAGLSVDHVVSMGLPLYGHWQDIDQADGAFLRYNPQPFRIGAPEYFVPAGVPFDSCMVSGGCSRELLERVYNTEASMRLVYLSVTRVDKNLQRLPLQMVGSNYHFQGAKAAGTVGVDVAQIEGQLSAARDAASAEGSAGAPAAKRYKILLPGVAFFVPPPPPVPPDDPTGCSPNGGCGWFTPDGRMVDYITY
jgi:hypothetical protein